MPGDENGWRFVGVPRAPFARGESDEEVMVPEPSPGPPVRPGWLPVPEEGPRGGLVNPVWSTYGAQLRGEELSYEEAQRLDQLERERRQRRQAERDQRIETERRAQEAGQVARQPTLDDYLEWSRQLRAGQESLLGQLRDSLEFLRYAEGEGFMATMTSGTLKNKVTGAAVVGAEAQAQPKLPALVFKGQQVESVVPGDLRHLVVATGAWGVGKTTFVCGIDRPENVLMVDFEGKGEGVASQLGVENYFAPTIEMANVMGFEYKALHAFQRTREILQQMPAGRFTVLILDGLMTLQQGMVEEVKRNPVAYGVKPENAASGSMGGPYPGVGVLLEMMFAAARTKGVKVIGITTEVGAVWGDRGPLLNKFEMKGQKIINKMSVLTVLLVKGAGPGAPPSGIVLKEQLAKTEFKDGRLVVTKRIPPKLPEASMATVYGYLERPANFAGLRPEEIPSDEELAPFEKTISKQQLADMKIWLEAMRAAAVSEEVGATEGAGAPAVEDISF